jgi:hypothetical protein
MPGLEGLEKRSNAAARRVVRTDNVYRRRNENGKAPDVNR